MKKVQPYLIGAALAAVVLMTMGQAQAPQGPRWEYVILENRFVNFKPGENQLDGYRLLQDKVMNQLGAEGWELVQTGPGGYLLRRAR